MLNDEAVNIRLDGQLSHGGDEVRNSISNISNPDCLPIWFDAELFKAKVLPDLDVSVMHSQAVLLDSLLLHLAHSTHQVS